MSKHGKRYLSYFLILLMIIGSINIGTASDINIKENSFILQDENVSEENSINKTECNQIELSTENSNTSINIEKVSSNNVVSLDNSNTQTIIEKPTETDSEQSEETLDSEQSEETLDNWELGLVFYDSTVNNGNTPLTEINWDASDGSYGIGETRIITVELNYEIENTETLNKGDIQISVPNLIYNSLENTNESPLWNTSVLLGANDSTHSGYEFTFTAGNIADITQEYYTFSNEIVLEPSIHKGSIQIIYNITPQEEKIITEKFAKIENYEDECFHERNMDIIANINNMIISNNIQFSYSRTYIHNEWKRVEYKLTQTADKIVSYDGLSDDAENYTWVKYTLFLEHSSNDVCYPNIHANKLHIIDNIPEDCLVYRDGKQIRNNIDIAPTYSSNAIYIEDIVSYDYLRQYNWKYEYYVGYPKEIYKNNTIFGETSELYGIYSDSTIEEKLDDSFININFSEFEFKYEGDPETGLYNISTYHDKNNNRHLLYQDIVNPDKEYWGYKKASNRQAWKISFIAKYKGTPMTLKIADDVLSATNIDGTIKKLNDNEYYFTDVSFNGNHFTNASGVKINPNKYDCELWVRYADSNKYVLHSSFKNPNGNKTFYFNDKKVVGWYIMIYDITETVEFDYNKISNMNDWNLKSILSSTTIFSKKDIPNSGNIYNFVYMNVYYRDGDNFILQNETTEELYESEITKELLQYDLETYGHCIQRNYAEDGWNYVIVTNQEDNLVSEIKFNETIQDNSNERFIGSCDIATKLNIAGAGVSQSMMYVEQFNKDYIMQGFKMYDLLPMGMELISTEEEIKNSLEVTAHTYHRLHAEDGTMLSGGNATVGPHLDIIKNAIDTNIKITENWNNTGRTRIEITGTLTEKLWLTSYYYGTWYKFNYQYNYSIPYESYMEYGNVYTNKLYVDKFDTQTKGYRLQDKVKDNGTSDSDAIDIDEDGNINDELSFKKDDLTINAIFSTYQNISIKAKTDLSNYDVGVINSSYDSSYTYRLGIITGSNNIKNVIFYDSIEQAYGKQDYWKGEFCGIDTSYAENKGYTVKTYYSENEDAGNLYNEDGSSNSNWSKYSESIDKTKVKSLAFEFLDENNNPIIIPSNTLMYVLINMKTPNDESINTLAYNKFNTEWNTVNSLGFESIEKTKLNSNIVKISLPHSLKSFGSYILKHEYYVRDKNGNLILENTISEELVEDIFEGVEINSSDLEHKYYHNNKQYQLLEDSSIVIEANIINNVIIKYVRDEYVFKIEWNDNNSQLRPQIYEVSLKKDGVIIETKKTSSNENCTFSNYFKFDEEGIEHIYEFEADIGDRYELIYDNERDVYIATIKESNFSVKIPKTIILDGNTGVSNYNIIANGNLYYNDTLIVKPKENFFMTDKNNLSNIQANISQDKISFKKDTLGLINGKIKIDKDQFAGDWKGFFNFDIKFIKQN